VGLASMTICLLIFYLLLVSVSFGRGAGRISDFASW
jgi:hypothetical protein